MLKKLIALPILAFIFVACGGGGTTGFKSDEFDAKVGCELFVEDRLKSPGTAEFSGAVMTPIKGKNTWKVRGFVDSQNSFGGVVRNEYICKVKVLENSYKLIDMETSNN